MPPGYQEHTAALKQPPDRPESQEVGQEVIPRLGFRVWGLGLRVKGLGFWGRGFRVECSLPF